MAVKFEKIKAGDRFYDNHRYKMGNTRMSRMGEWHVHVVSVDAEKRTAVVSWNGNPPQTWSEARLKRLFATPMREREAKKEARKAASKVKDTAAAKDTP